MEGSSVQSGFSTPRATAPVRVSESPSSGPSSEPLSKWLVAKLQQLKVGARQLPKALKEFFGVAAEQIDENKLMLFELFNLSPLQTLFSEVKTLLTKQLIDQNKSCSASQRSQFYEIMGSDLLPLLTTSKFDLCQLCLVGFDIYVGPYEAILDLVGRLSNLTEQISVSAKLPAVRKLISAGRPVKLEAIRLGYDYFRVFCNCYQLDLNLYMLGEYIKKATKALDRRAKDIIFTGCYGLFQKLLPVLIDLELHGLLNLAASTNYELLTSHPSYDYFLFFAKVPVKPQFEYLFEAVREVLNKSLLTYTLTPFMFGVLRNYELFKSFLQQLNHQCWVKFAKVIVQGLAIVIKSGSMRFSEITDLLQVAVDCTYLDNDIYRTAMDCLSKPNGPEWHEVDSFFRSAIKAGYNTGIYAAFHRLDDQQMEQHLRQILISGLISLKDVSDLRLFQQWLLMLQPKKDTHETLLNSLLEKQLKRLDPQFNLLEVGSISHSYKIPQVLEGTSVKQLDQTVVRVLNILKVLNYEYKKNYLQAEAFREYLLALATTLFEKWKGTACRQLAEYVLVGGPNSHSAFLANLHTIETLPLSEGFLADYLKRTAASSNSEGTRQLVDYIVVCLKKSRLAGDTLALLERTFLHPLAPQNKKYLKYNFSKVRLDEVPVALAEATSFYGEAEISRMIETLYSLNTQTNVLTLNPVPTVQPTEPVTVKTLNEDMVTDVLFVQLTPQLQELLSVLIDNIVLHYPKKEGQELGCRCLQLLDHLSSRYPILDYFILSYSATTSAIKLPLGESALPEYLHFGVALSKIVRIDPTPLSFLLRMLRNRAVLTRDGQPFIAKILLPNIISALMKSVKEASRLLSKELCLQHLQILEAVIRDHSQDRLVKLVASAALSLLRGIAKDCQADIVVTLLQLFERLVKVEVGDNYHAMKAQLRAESLRYTLDLQINIPPAVEFPHCEVVVLSQQPDKQSKDRYMGSLKGQGWKELSAYTINLTRIKTTVKAQMDRSPSKSQQAESPKTKNYDELEDILGSTNEGQEQQSHTYTGCRSPELSFKQICVCMEKYLMAEDQVIQTALLNCRNSALVTLFATGLYLYGIEAYKSGLNLKECSAQVLRDRCLSLLQNIGFSRVLNTKVRQLANVPAELRVFNQQPASADLSLLGLLLKKLLQEPSNQLIDSFLKQFMSTVSIDNCQQLMYSASVDIEVINLIQKKLPVQSVKQLSLLVHSNPQTLRSYFGSLVEGMTLMHFPSRLLNYHEYIKLTGEWHSDKQFIQLFQIYRLNWEFFQRILQERQIVSCRQAKMGLRYKLSVSRPTEDIVREYYQEVSTNEANLLSKLAEVVSKGNVADALRRHADLYNTLLSMQQQNKITQEQLDSFNIVPTFRALCRLFGKGVALSSFIVHNRHGSLQLADIELPKYIQFWEEATNTTQKALPVNVPIGAYDIARIELSKVGELPSPTQFLHRRYELTIEGTTQQEHSLWRKQIEAMRSNGLIAIQAGEITFQACSEEQLKEFKTLGAIYGCVLSKNISISDKFTKELAYYIRRERLPWKLLEHFNKQAYAYINSILSQQTVRDMNLTFTYQKEQLIPRGSEKRVTDFNRKEYCNLLALSKLAPIRPQAQSFINGLASTVFLDRLDARLLPQ